MTIASLDPEFVFCDYMSVPQFPYTTREARPVFAWADYFTLEWSPKSETRPQLGQHLLSFGAKFGH